MPPCKRGSAKKKKKKPKKSLSSNATRPHGESDGDENSSSKSQQSSPHPVVKAEKKEHNASGNQSLTIDRTGEAANETQSEIEINRGSNSKKSHEKREDNSSGNQSLTIDRTKEAANNTQSEIEINRGSNSQKSLKKSSSSRSRSSNDKSHVDKKKAVGIQPAAVADLVQLAKEAQSEIISRGSNSHNSLQKSSSSRSRSSNDKSHVDKKKTVEIQPVAVADLEAQSIIEISRGSNSHNSLQKSSSSRSSSSNDKSRVDKKKALVIQPAAVADLVQLAKEAQSVIEISRGSNSHNSLEKSSSSRSNSSNDKSHVDQNKERIIQPATVPDLVQLVKEAKSEIEINRSSSQKSHEKSSSSRSSSSNDKSHVDTKKTVVIQPAAVADLVQLAKEPLCPTVIEINRGSKSLEKRSSSRSSNLNDKSHVDEEKAVVIQPDAVAGLVQPIVDPARPVSSLVELASQVFDSTKLQEKNDLVVTETPLEQNNSPTSTSEVVGSVPKENEVVKNDLVSSDDKASPKSNDCLPASTNAACRFCGRNPTDRVNEPETPELSEKQPLLGAASRPVEKTSWKSCCGIFELCSGSSR